MGKLWYNFDTQEYDELENPPYSAGPDGALSYIPSTAGRNMYTLLVDKMNWRPEYAYLKALGAEVDESKAIRTAND